MAKQEEEFDFEAMSEDERMFVEQAIVAEVMYEGVLAKLDVEDKDSRFTLSVLKGILKKRTKDHIVVTIWQSSPEAQLEHFNDYLNSMAVVVPDLDKDAMVMDFALLYPALMMAIFESLPEFFDNFVEEFNRLHAE